tara:strand:+ start:882 stop:2111 length:1230 start_codon:yes stop_codon:yes gene_type:complete
MATRKSLVIVSGLFEELNSSSDKLDLAGNTTADLTENTNLYYTNARARGAVSVTDSGGLGSLAYNNSSGVITYTGPANSDITGLISVASGSGLTYSGGEIGTNAIPNSQLANSSVTVGSTSINLGATASTIAGLTSLTATTLYSGAANAANSISIASGDIVFEGSTANSYETTLRATDATADRVITLPNETGTILTTASTISPTVDTFTLGSTSIQLGSTTTTVVGLTALTATTLYAGAANAANSVSIGTAGLVFEGSTADAYETTINVVDATADRAINFPNAAGTVALMTSLSVAAGSGLTYNSGTGAFSTSNIPNSQLQNSSITIGSSSAALGGTVSTITGLTSLTSNAVVTNDDGFRIRDNSDNTKQLAFECSGISGSTTRTLTAPNESGTIATESFATAIAVALG